MTGSIAGKNILLVEDDALVAATVEEMLLYAQARSVVVAASVDAAIRALDGSAFDVAILDVNLRGEMSWGVARELQRRCVDYVTVSGNGELLEHALARNLLPKPYSMDQLFEAMSTTTRLPAMAPVPTHS
jgi:DNA-binding response OmpR family regulator